MPVLFAWYVCFILKKTKHKTTKLQNYEAKTATNIFILYRVYDLLSHFINKVPNKKPYNILFRPDPLSNMHTNRNRKKNRELLNALQLTYKLHYKQY